MSKPIFLRPGTHCLLPLHALIIEQIKALKFVEPDHPFEDGYNQAVDHAVSILEKVRAIDPTESNELPTDHKAVFEMYGDRIAKEILILDKDGECTGIEFLTIEGLYQAFKARLMEELQSQKVKDWGLDK